MDEDEQHIADTLGASGLTRSLTEGGGVRLFVQPGEFLCRTPFLCKAPPAQELCPASVSC
jgi:hypothetical protein